MASLQINHYSQIFQIRAFRAFWTGFTLSAIGDAMTRVALTWFVYEKTGSAAALGWLTLAYTGPVLIGGLVAGTLLDRFDRRKVMLVDSVLRGVAVALVPILNWSGDLPLWVVYAVAAVYGSLMMVSLAGAPAMIPSLVPKERLDTANALETLSFTLSGVIGPPLAGLLIAWIGAPNVVILDMLSYFAFALALASIRMPEEHPAAEVQSAEPLRWVDAFRLLWTNQVLLATTAMFMAANFGLGLSTVWLPVYTDQVLGGGAGLYGFLLGCLAVGEVVSSLLAGSLNLALPLGTLIALAQVLSGGAVGILLLGSQAAWAILSLTLLGFFSAPLTIWAQTLRMQIIPPALRGRTFALLRTLMQGALPAGGALAGFLLPVVGIPLMIALSAIVIGAPGLVGYQLPGLRRAGEPQRELVDPPRETA
jgi:MFS family permease